MSVVRRYKGFEIHYIPKYPTDKDAEAYLFEAIKHGLKFLSILRYVSKSRVSSITEQEIIDIGIADIKKLIDKIENEFERPIPTKK